MRVRDAYEHDRQEEGDEKAVDCEDHVEIGHVTRPHDRAHFHRYQLDPVSLFFGCMVHCWFYCCCCRCRWLGLLIDTHLAMMTEMIMMMMMMTTIIIAFIFLERLELIHGIIIISIISIMRVSEIR